MKASIVDLRYKMKEVLKALDKNEQVEIMYHGRLKGILSPIRRNGQKKVKDHPFFGMNRGRSVGVKKEMSKLRENRYDLI